MDLPDICIIREFRTTTEWDSTLGSTPIAFPAGTIPRFALDGCGRLTHRVFGEFQQSSSPNNFVLQCFTTPDIVTAGTEVSGTQHSVSVTGTGTLGYFDWLLEVIPIAQSDGTFVHWFHSWLKIAPDSAAAMQEFEQWKRVTTLTFPIDFYTSYTPTANQTVKPGQITGVISPARFSWL